jgi:WD40-like Beta Propeller Repeat
MRLLAFGFLGLTLACVAAFAAPQVDQKVQSQTRSAAPAPSFHEEVLREFSPESKPQEWMASEHHVAWVEKQGGSRIVKLDGKQQGGVYQEVKYFGGSSDVAHLAFFGKRGSKWVLVLDGQEHPQEYTKTTSLAFRPKGTSLAYCACFEKKCRLVVDGADAGPEYEDITYPQFSSDGKRLAYLGKRGKKWIAVVDGKETGPELDGYMVDFGFDPTGNRFYVARAKGTVLGYVVDGVAGPLFTVLSPIAFSSDGKRYTYGGTTQKPTFKFKDKVVGTLVLDSQTKAEYEGEGISRLTLAAFAGFYANLKPGLRNLYPFIDGLSNPAFDSEGKLVYAARRGKGDIAVLVGSDSGPGFEVIVSQIAFTHDAKHFVYIGSRRGEHIMVMRDNIQIRTALDSYTGWFSVEWIGLTGDAAHVAYEIVSSPKEKSGRETHLVNVDGHESRSYDEVLGARFTEDEKSVAFVARDGMRILYVTYALTAPPTSMPGREAVREPLFRTASPEKACL